MRFKVIAYLKFTKKECGGKDKKGVCPVSQRRVSLHFIIEGLGFT